MQKNKLTTYCQGTMKNTEPDSEVTQMILGTLKYHMHEQTGTFSRQMKIIGKS